MKELEKVHLVPLFFKYVFIFFIKNNKNTKN